MGTSGAPSPDDPDHGPVDTSRDISLVDSDPLPGAAVAGNVQGRKVTTPDEGFGKLWRKRYWIRLTGSLVTPAELVRTWQTHYTEFWPKGSHLYQPADGLQQGDVAGADLLMIGGVRIGTGVVVIDENETSFTLASLQGHTFCGTITFTARDDNGVTMAEVEAVLRASDPLYEIGMALGGHWYENRFWKATLVALARYFDVKTTPSMSMECLDSRRKWRNATNIVHNALLHTTFYLIARQLRRLAHWLRSRGKNA